MQICADADSNSVHACCLYTTWSSRANQTQTWGICELRSLTCLVSVKSWTISYEHLYSPWADWNERVQRNRKQQTKSISLSHTQIWTLKRIFGRGCIYLYISSGVYMQSKKKKKKILIQMHQKEPRPLQSYSTNSMHQSVLFHLHSKLGILLKRNTLYFLSFYCYCLLYCRWTWMKQVPDVTCIITVIPSLDSRTFFFIYLFFKLDRK